MPPSRTVSTNERVAARWAGSARLCEGTQCPLQNVGGGPATERASVELDDGHELPDGGGREHLLGAEHLGERVDALLHSDRKSTRLNSSHTVISYAVFCLKKKKK